MLVSILFLYLIWVNSLILLQAIAKIESIIIHAVAVKGFPAIVNRIHIAFQWVYFFITNGTNFVNQKNSFVEQGNTSLKGLIWKFAIQKANFFVNVFLNVPIDKQWIFAKPLNENMPIVFMALQKLQKSRKTKFHQLTNQFIIANFKIFFFLNKIVLELI